MELVALDQRLHQRLHQCDPELDSHQAQITACALVSQPDGSVAIQVSS
jgi:hypothetical protein